MKGKYHLLHEFITIPLISIGESLYITTARPEYGLKSGISLDAAITAIEFLLAKSFNGICIIYTLLIA